MFADKISQYFEGVAAKYLSAVDAEPTRSNGHEIGGLAAAGFKTHLGTPNKHEEFRFRAKQVYISDEADAPIVAESHVTWYDARRNKPARAAEYRLYYKDTQVMSCIAEGDFFLVAKLREGVLPNTAAQLQTELSGEDRGSLLMVFTPAGSSAEQQLRVMFGLDTVGSSFSAGILDSISLVLPLRMMLEELGVEVEVNPAQTDKWLDSLIAEFGGMQFPTTSVFSRFARESVETQVDPVRWPDAALMAWMDHEEALFRIYEHHLVQIKLREGFGEDGLDVDAFIDFSLSVQNRRKSRVGYAFERHLEHLFQYHELGFEQGRGKDKVTENNSKPDFIFPSFSAYRNPDFPASKLVMLGAKTTCKDRWRQVLSEADRIESKHLVTLEASISNAQLEEMRSHKLQLVVPQSIQKTYSSSQRLYLLDVEHFMDLVKKLCG